MHQQPPRTHDQRDERDGHAEHREHDRAAMLRPGHCPLALHRSAVGSTAAQLRTMLIASRRTVMKLALIIFGLLATGGVYAACMFC